MLSLRFCNKQTRVQIIHMPESKKVASSPAFCSYTEQGHTSLSHRPALTSLKPFIYVYYLVKYLCFCLWMNVDMNFCASVIAIQEWPVVLTLLFVLLFGVAGSLVRGLSLLFDHVCRGGSTQIILGHRICRCFRCKQARQDVGSAFLGRLG